jgi:hypothetical protein
MTKKTFIEGDQIGPYRIDEFAGSNNRGELVWWVTQNGQPKIITEKKLRAVMAKADWSPEKIRQLSSKAYTELCKEIGEETVEEIVSASAKKSDAPPLARQYEIAAKWWEMHPQIARTRANVELFDSHLAKMPNPTFTSKDLDIAFSELFFDLELNPKAAGIDGHGEGIRGRALDRLSSAQLQQLQKAFPVPVPVDFNKLSEDEILKEIAKTTTADGFLEYTKQVDAETGVEQPVSPLVRLDWDRAWKNFFELNLDISPTDELKNKLLKVLATQKWPLQTQYLTMALNSLIEAGDPSVTKQQSNVYRHAGGQLVLNEPRPKTPLPVYDDSPVTVTLAEINAMNSAEYGRKSLNPEFRKAVDALMQKVGR